MTEGRWRAAWDLYQKSCELPPDQRRKFVESAATDSGIAQEVLSLLAEPSVSRYGPAVETGKTPGSDAARWPYSGKTIGSFVVAQPLGRGGMGEVYSALDKDLNRTVAIKFLPAASLGTPNDVTRVLREARAAASLNHPGVVTVHEVIHHESSLAIVMELVDGASLRKVCGQTRPVGEVVAWGRQIAEAIGAAHAHGIVHRDLKPENIMVRDDGIVKILDFGLARQIGGESVHSAADLPVGTLRYMSPEQIRGEDLTPASDVFSLGLVLYELATGSHPFPAESALETTHLILSRDADAPSARNPEIPRNFDLLVRSMLAKDARRRPDAATVANALDEIRENPFADAALAGIPSGTPEAIAAEPGSSIRRRRLLAAAAVLAAIGTTAAGIVWEREAPHAETALRPALTGAPLTSSLGMQAQPAFSPDGRQIAYTWDGGPDPELAGIYVKSIDSGPPRRLSQGAAGDYNPAWSPGGDQIAFLRPYGNRAKVMIVPAAGGAAREVAEVEIIRDPKKQLTWSPREDELVLSDAVGDVPQWRLQILNLVTGERRMMTSPPPGWNDIIPQYSFDRRLLAFLRRRGGTIQAELMVMDAAGGQPRSLFSPRLSAHRYAWSADNRKLIYVGGAIQPDEVWEVDLASRQPRRAPFVFPAIADEIAISSRGSIAWIKGERDVDIWSVEAGSGSGAQRLIASSKADDDPQYSPDGERIAFSSKRSGVWEIWVCSADGSNARPVTSQRAFCGSPRWSPDGKEIVFDAYVEGTQGIFTVPAEGGQSRRLPGPADAIMPSYSRDGKWIYVSEVRNGVPQVCKVPRRGGEPVQVTQNGGMDVVESFDGQYLYYKKDRVQGIWRMPVSGGPEEVVPGTETVAMHRHWDLRPEGLYFFDPEPPPKIRMLDLNTNRIRDIASVWTPSGSGGRGLSVAPGGHSFLLKRSEIARAEIVVANNFPR